MRLYVVVEGQTEEAFVKQVIRSHLRPRGVDAYPVIVQTSRQPAGRKFKGGGFWKHWSGDLRRLIIQQKGPDVRFTTMFDLYGLPPDFPDLARHSSDQDTKRRAENLANAMAQEMSDYRFIPYLQRHEFEALVLASLDQLEALLDDPSDLSGVAALRTLLLSMAPEDVNDGADTAPSKRLVGHIPSYQKTYHGPLAVSEAGLDILRKSCPHFGDWLGKLEALGTATL